MHPFCQCKALFTNLTVDNKVQLPGGWGNGNITYSEHSRNKVLERGKKNLEKNKATLSNLSLFLNITG